MYGFLLECLNDLNESFQSVGTKLHIFQGCPLEVFRHLRQSHCINKLCFIQDCEPIWHERDNAVKSEFCSFWFCFLFVTIAISKTLRISSFRFVLGVGH